MKKNSFTPCFLNCSTCHSNIGFPRIGIIGFGIVLVIGRNRVPNPPAEMTACLIIVLLLPLRTYAAHSVNISSHNLFFIFWEVLIGIPYSGKDLPCDSVRLISCQKQTEGSSFLG